MFKFNELKQRCTVNEDSFSDRSLYKNDKLLSLLNCKDKWFRLLNFDIYPQNYPGHLISFEKFLKKERYYDPVSHLKYQSDFNDFLCTFLVEGIYSSDIELSVLCISIINSLCSKDERFTKDLVKAGALKQLILFINTIKYIDIETYNTKICHTLWCLANIGAQKESYREIFHNVDGIDLDQLLYLIEKFPGYFDMYVTRLLYVYTKCSFIDIRAIYAYSKILSILEYTRKEHIKWAVKVYKNLTKNCDFVEMINDNGVSSFITNLIINYGFEQIYVEKNITANLFRVYSNILFFTSSNMLNMEEFVKIYILFKDNFINFINKRWVWKYLNSVFDIILIIDDGFRYDMCMHILDNIESVETRCLLLVFQFFCRILSEKDRVIQELLYCLPNDKFIEVVSRFLESEVFSINDQESLIDIFFSIVNMFLFHQVVESGNKELSVLFADKCLSLVDKYIESNSPYSEKFSILKSNTLNDL